MKKFITFTFVFTFLVSLQLSAQLRSNLNDTPDYSSSVVNTSTSTVQSTLNNFFMNNMEMSHSYSMSFGSFGGSYQNVNAYTNTMKFALTDNLGARLDVSFLHSPFGPNNFANSNNNLGGEIIIRNAELNYQINDNAHIKFQYRQMPRTYGFYGPYGYDRMSPWY